MSRFIHLITTSLAVLEDTAPPYNLRHPSKAENIDLARSLLEAAGASQPDLVCLPEGFFAAGQPLAAVPSLAEPIPGPVFEMVTSMARKYHMNVVAGLYVKEGDQIFNVAALVDRQGDLVGTYAKNHPTESEILCGVTPGSSVPVFDVDFGRIGLAICFDLNWKTLWSHFEESQVDLVCWISAYEGGFPLQANAWQHQYPIVSSVWPYHARVIDVSGRIVASTSRWNRLASYDLNLDREIFHTDEQASKILPIQQKYGRKIKIETFTEEHLFILESLVSDLTVQDIIAEFGLVPYKEYIARCTEVQTKSLSIS